jgi:methionyl-tRNA synthetase
MGLFMALNEIAGREAGAFLPVTVPNRHTLYMGQKASSSGSVTPPNPAVFYDYYTADQLRMHFMHMATHSNSVSFNPKAMMTAEKSGFDATLAEGNILTNVYNRLVRSCFYSLQKYYNGKLPQRDASCEVQDAASALIEEYEWAMYRFEFAKVIDLMDVYLRDANKTWVANTKEADALCFSDVVAKQEEANFLRTQTLTDTFHVVRVAAALLHPFAPEGTERVREYLRFDERLYDWEYIDEPMSFFMAEGHEFKVLEPRVDFFLKHPSQLGS